MVQEDMHTDGPTTDIWCQLFAFHVNINLKLQEHAKIGILIKCELKAAQENNARKT